MDTGNGMTMQHIDKCRAQLQTQLFLLRHGKLRHITYGKRNEDRFSFLRIRFINTAGGPQFGIKTIDSFGQEGSGDYTPNADIALEKAMNLMMYYHRPTPMSKYLEAKGKKPDLSEFDFWGFSDEPEPPKIKQDHSEFIRKLGGEENIATIELSLEDSIPNQDTTN